MVSLGAKVWVPESRLDAVVRRLDDSEIVRKMQVAVMPGSDEPLFQVGLRSPGKVGGLSRYHVLARVKRFESDGARLGVGAEIAISQGHSMYPNGLLFTTYSEVDIKYHLDSRTLEEVRGIDRIEVPRPDNGDNLDLFVADAYAGPLYLHRTARERDLVFFRTYAPRPTIIPQL